MYTIKLSQQQAGASIFDLFEEKKKEGVSLNMDEVFIMVDGKYVKNEVIAHMRFTAGQEIKIFLIYAGG